MRESIGSTFLYNMIFIFIIIVFGLLSATLSYYKSFKINERILYSIDKFEGYNSLAQAEIENILSSLGYTVDPEGQSKCSSTRSDGVLITANTSYRYCVYYYSDDRGRDEKNIKNNDGEPIYYNYSVVTYIYINLPIVGNFQIPVHTKGERIFNFSDKQSQGGVRA